MAASTRILSLNLGMQTIGLAEFRIGPNGGLIMQGYRLTELIADPAAEASRSAQIRVAIQDMMSSLKVKGGKVNYAISAQSVFTRFVKLPSVAEEKVDQIIGFEAQQNVPFPIDEVVWDYQLVASGQEEKVEVVLVAIKSDLLDDVNQAVEDSKLTVSTVDVAPMALYNAFRYNYSDLTGCSLIIDIGARTTNLIFVEPKKVFSRSLSIGGTMMTSAIAKDFNEPFATSEERKKSSGFVSLGGAYAEPPDPDVARVSKVIRNTMTRLHMDISRSISFYRSQQQGSAPERVFLCGGNASLPYMREFFREKLGLPIEFFNPLRNVSVGLDVNVEEAGKSAHVLGELVGLGLRAVSECPMELNLRPASVVAAQKLAGQRPFLVVAGVCLLLCLAGWWLYFLRAADIEAQVLEKLEPQIAALKGFEGKIEAVRKEQKVVQETTAPFLQAVDAREYWVRVIDDLNARLPEDFIWVTLFEPSYFTPDGKATPIPIGETGGSAAVGQPKATFGVRIRGLYLDNPKQAGVVDDFVKNLSASPLYSKVTQKVRATPTATEWAYEYELNLELKKPLSQQ